MPTELERIRGLSLSAVEIQELTGWGDAMVEDYLNILESLIMIATQNDELVVKLQSTVLGHPSLNYRHAPNQHPISAITGLAEALANTGGGQFNIDGGRADSVYTPPQSLDGGGA